MNSTDLWTRECWETFIDIILIPLFAYGSVSWIAILGALT